MSKQANKTLVGAFVVGAVALLVTAIIILGTGSLFTQSPRMVLFFSGSVMGLNVGSPVVFRGVPIGSVKSINLLWNQKTLDFRIPVVIEINSNSIVYDEDYKVSAAEQGRLLNSLIQKGLRGQLALQSFVTGQLMISLDFMPHTPALLQGHTSIPELPTVPSPMEELQRTLQNLPIDRIAEQLLAAVEGLNKVVNSPEVKDTSESIRTVLAELSILLRNADKQITPLGTSAQKTLDTYNRLALRIDERLPETLSGLNRTLDSIDKASKRTQQALASADQLLSNDSRTVVDLQTALRELAGAARALRVFADYLERHPDALIKGK